MTKQELNSNSSSNNYQAGRDVRVHHGNIFNTLSNSKLVQFASAMTVIGVLIALAQYISGLPVNAKLQGPSLKYESGWWEYGRKTGFTEKSFLFRFENLGPDAIKNLSWYANISGLNIDISNDVKGSVPLVAPGSVYYVKNLTSSDIQKKIDFGVANKSIEKWRACMIFDGKFPGMRQWIELSGERQDSDAISKIISDIYSNESLKITDIGSGFAVGSNPCKNL